MKVVGGLFDGLTDVLRGNWVLCLLVGLGVSYTVVTKGIQIRSAPWMIREFGGWDKKKTKVPGQDGGQGMLSSAQALCAAIASCMGNGNIVGVVTMLITGGPGALLQTWIAVFFEMVTRCAEIVLDLFCREKTGEGMYQGGPVYYIVHGLYAPWLGVVTAMLLFFQSAGATLIQSNTISSVPSDIGHVPKPATGTVLMITMSFIIRGGLKRLTHVAQRIVPVMAGFYIIGRAVVMLSSLGSFLPMLSSIVRGAFSLEAGMGAVVGVTMREAMWFGVAKGLYFNEAGKGSAVVIHSSVNVDRPVRQGFYDVVEVFADTTAICSTTSFAILSSGIPMEGASTTPLAVATPGTVLPAFRCVVSVSLVLFAATLIMSQ